MSMKEPSPLFVLSTGRCGTLSLQKFLNRQAGHEAFHRGRVEGPYRNPVRIIYEQNFAYYHVVRPEQPDPTARSSVIGALRGSRRDLIRQVHEDGKVFAELNHGFSGFGPLLAEAFPDAKFVHLVRRPRDVVTSFLTKFDPPPFSKQGYMGRRHGLRVEWMRRFRRVRQIAGFLSDRILEFVKEREWDPHLRPFERRDGAWTERDWPPFRKACWYWHSVNENIERLRDVAGDERYLRVRAEDLWDSEERGEKQRLLAFVPGPTYPVDDLVEHYAERINPKSERRDFPSPAEWTEEMEAELERTCGPLARSYGYATESSPRTGG